jgi:alpha-beta hydrolase superfamily lysophospholipase
VQQRAHTKQQQPVADSAADESWLSMPDGQRLFLHDWPVENSRGSVLIVHGLGEHGARYRDVAQWFNQRGYSARSYDQRGHGRSPGQRGALRHGDDLLSDLTMVYRDYENRASTPPLLLGHSMGGLVALRTVLDERIAPQGLVLSSPALRSWEANGMIKLAWVLAHVVPRLPLRNGLPYKYLSHDTALVESYRNDPLRTAMITPRLADFIFRAGASCIEDAHRLAVPTMLLVADSDHLVDPGGSRDFARAAASTEQLTTRFFSTLYHELFNESEPGRGQVRMQLADWMTKRL